MIEPLPDPQPCPPPPMLNWAEREAGLPGQPPLPGLEDKPTAAERVFVELARRWHEQFAVVAHDHAPSRLTDELALAAVLLAREHGRFFTDVAWDQAKRNTALAEERLMPWIDGLPWELTCGAWRREPHYRPPVEELINNLNHPNSALRIWTMELAWMSRPFPEWDIALPNLLENVAGTLARVDIAWGLAGTFFKSKEPFHATAESWQPEDFADQYTECVSLLKARSLTATQASFWKMEAACRRLIVDTAFSVR